MAQLDWLTTSHSPTDTETLAESIGRMLKGGEVIELVSDLGGGKTTFVRGLAKGFGSGDHVASPTFTLSKVYKAGPRQLRHFDFYRLQESGMVGHELSEAMADPNTTVIIEWAEIVAFLLPPERFQIKMFRVGEADRELRFSYPESLAYLLSELNTTKQ